MLSEPVEDTGLSVRMKQETLIARLEASATAARAISGESRHLYNLNDGCTLWKPANQLDRVSQSLDRARGSRS